MIKWLVLCASLVWFSMASADEKRVFGGEFCLHSIEGEKCLSDFKQKLVLLYFGYTACPDICPTSLAVLTSAYQALPPAVAKEVVMLMVTLDPERDSEQKLADYVHYFHPTMLGLRGDAEQTQNIARQYGASYQKVPLSPSALGYVVDHSASIYLINQEGVLVGQFKHGSSKDDIVAGILYLHDKMSGK